MYLFQERLLKLWIWIYLIVGCLIGIDRRTWGFVSSLFIPVGWVDFFIDIDRDVEYILTCVGRQVCICFSSSWRVTYVTCLIFGGYIRNYLLLGTTLDNRKKRKKKSSIQLRYLLTILQNLRAMLRGILDLGILTLAKGWSRLEGRYFNPSVWMAISTRIGTRCRVG